MAYNFSFSSGHHITVTSPHLMMIKKEKEFYFLRADNVELGDKMMVDGVESEIMDIKVFQLKTKVAIETEDATIQTNGVLASGLCDYNPDVVDRIVFSEALVTDYKASHFGERFNDMCMDFKSWANAFKVNNKFLD